MLILNGKEVSQETRREIAQKTAEFKEKTGVTPGLAVVIVGDDPASCVYVRNKRKGCEEVGFYSEQYDLTKDTKEEALLALIARLNDDPKIHGILVQLPLPAGINTERVTDAILPEKDVDAFHPVNVGKIMIGNYRFVPCTPAGIMRILSYYDIPIEGKKCVIIGRSNIVGKPMAHLLMEKNGTVTVCHTKTPDLLSYTRDADILVVAMKKREYIKADMVKPGAVVIDVGIHRTEDGKVTGDVDFAGVSEVASAITPVPGGVGPMTITMLLQNTLKAAEESLKRKSE